VRQVLVAVGSMKGSPGATTFAVVLAAVWPGGPATMLEADCAGGDIGGRCWLADTPGLAGLASAVRSGRSPLAEYATPLPCGVPVVVAPASRQAATVAVGLLADAEVQAWAADLPVVVDVGRLDPGMPSTGLALAADVLLVLTDGGAASLLRLADTRVPRDRSRLLLVGSCDYCDDDIAEAVGLPVAGHVPRDPRAAAVVWGRRPPNRSWTSRGLPATARALANELDAGTRSPAGLAAVDRPPDATPEHLPHATSPLPAGSRT
jgi:hypothetical protein